MSVCASVARSTTPVDLRHLALHLAGQLPKRRQIVAEDLHGDVGARAGQHVVDAVRDRLADRDVGARQQRHLLPQLLEHRLARPVLHLQADVDLRRFDALHVLVELRAAGSPRRRRHLRHAEHQPLQRVAQRVRIGEARARDGHGADGQRAFVELGEKRSARCKDADERGDQQRRRPLPARCRQYVNAWPSQRSYAAFRRCVSRGSAPDAIRRDCGSSHEHSTGVTVSATTATRSAPRRSRTRAAAAGGPRRCST